MAEENKRAGYLLLILIVLIAFFAGWTSNTKMNKPVAKPLDLLSFSVKGPGICEVTNGGKTWLLVDMTNELIDRNFEEENNAKTK